MRSFVNTNGEFILSFTDIGKSCPSGANMAFSAIREYKILAKISGFTVFLICFQDAIPQYHVGHYKVLENISSYIQDHKLPLSLIGSSYKGVSVNDCINNARLAVEDVTGLDLQF